MYLDIYQDDDPIIGGDINGIVGDSDVDVCDSEDAAEIVVLDESGPEEEGGRLVEGVLQGPDGEQEVRDLARRAEDELNGEEERDVRAAVGDAVDVDGGSPAPTEQVAPRPRHVRRVLGTPTREEEDDDDDVEVDVEGCSSGEEGEGGAGKPTSRCPLCPAAFWRVEHRTRHLRCHLGPRRAHGCSSCTASFNRNDQLQAHERLHRGERPYRCVRSGCGRGFLTKEMAREHAAADHRDLPFRCEECGDAFLRALSLQRHARAHTGEKPFACPQCDKRFANSPSKRRHVRVHHSPAAARAATPEADPPPPPLPLHERDV
ncbi:Zinc finger protein 91 [Frankliniella fusca]|uniref:Zinc finger protein 91 n=1 Tax=Frankliniella fusca TaxID=407009 RepID=A0AAE1H638_9NEOP|nr:Zinc finger protein 91 [Frankliniella fusca]